jgi:hypothetical protein
VDEPSRFDKFVRNKFGQPQAGPAARKRGGVRLMDEPNNPGLHATERLPDEAPQRGSSVSGGERGVDEPSRSDKFVRNNKDSPKGWPWSAKRGRVRPKDGPNNPTLHATERLPDEAS